MTYQPPTPHNTIDAFRQAMQANNLLPASDIVADGQLHRFTVAGDKPGSKNGWYVLYPDGIPAGSYGSWKSGETVSWCATTSQSMNPDEQADYQRRLQHIRQAREAEQKHRQSETATKCYALWDQAEQPVCANHAYLTAKQIGAYGIRQLNRALLIPLINHHGELRSLQFIQPDGSKRFKSGGQVHGCYHRIGKLTDTLFICEGYATGATLHAATGHGVIVAFNANNLLPVATLMREKYPDKSLAIAADNDTKTPGNPGLTKGRETASAINAALFFPEFADNKAGSDFNDLAILKGHDAVKAALETPPPTDVIDDHAIINKLAQLPPVEYERQREAAADQLGIKRLSMLDTIVKQRRGQTNSSPDDNELENGLPPWENPVNGLELISHALDTLHRYTILPEGADIALSLWSLGTFCFNNFRIFPKLCLSSPEKRCGKTTTMEILGALTHRSLLASNITPACIFRSVDLWQPTLLIDEGDTFIRGNEELRGIINSGHTRSGAFVLRTEGEGTNRQPRKFSTWAPMAIAMIKTPPDTIQDRSVMVTLRRKLPGEKADRLPIELNAVFKPYRQQCMRWAEDNKAALKQAHPVIPSVGNDRAEDNWGPLLAIAGALGGEWPVLARNAMLTLEGGRDNDTDSIGPMILADIQAIFADRQLTKISSSNLVDALADLEERPWGEWKHGKPLTQTSLARMLKPYNIVSKTIRDGYAVKRGYFIDAFEDAFNRYLPPRDVTATVLQATDDVGYRVAFDAADTALKNTGATRQAPPLAACSGVALQKAVNGDGNRDREVFEL